MKGLIPDPRIIFVHNGPLIGRAEREHYVTMSLIIHRDVMYGSSGQKLPVTVLRQTWTAFRSELQSYISSLKLLDTRRGGQNGSLTILLSETLSKLSFRCGSCHR